MKKILVTGATGQVGKALKASIDSQKYEGHFLSRAEFNLSDAKMMQEALATIQPDCIINAAAYTQVDLAEENAGMACTVNIVACQILAEYCKTNNLPLVHYSSDYVYHNGVDRPLREADHTDPKSVYAKTKHEGEKMVSAGCKHHFIIRTSWVYDATGQNFVRTMLALSEKYDALTVVDDQIGSPTYAPDIADLTWRLVSKHFEGQIDDEAYGVYNFSNEGVCSWFDFAHAIFDLSNVKINLKPVPSTAYPRPAPRPHYSVMDKAKVRTLLPEYQIPHWRDSLITCLSEIADNAKA